MSRLSFPAVTTNHIDSVSRLAGEIWPLVYSGMISGEQIDYMLNWMYDPARIRDEMAEGIAYHFLDLESEHIGFMSFGPPVRGGWVFVHKLYLHPDYHRRGFGKAALDEIEKIVRSSGGIGLELRVNRNNERAFPLYRKAGFELIGEECKDIGAGFVMDDFIFRKTFH